MNLSFACHKRATYIRVVLMYTQVYRKQLQDRIGGSKFNEQSETSLKKARAGTFFICTSILGALN